MADSGVVVKLMKEHKQERYLPASLGEAGRDNEGYYLKIDCEDRVQVYVCLTREDVQRVIREWGSLLTDDIGLGSWPCKATPSASECHFVTVDTGPDRIEFQEGLLDLLNGPDGMAIILLG